MMDYVARFTELARFADDYVAIDMAKVRRFENGLKLSIRARIVRLCLQDMDSMVGTTLTIERERERMLGALEMRVLVARGRVNLLLVRGRGRRLLLHTSSEKRQRASSSRGFQSRGHPGQGHMRVAGQAGQMVCYHCQ